MIFIECETCAAKTGTPTLCRGCLHNRAEIASLMRWKAEHIFDWRPIAEAPIPGPDEAPASFVFNCILQDASRIVGEGIARFVSDGRMKGNKHVRTLRWYWGDGTRDSRVCHAPVYFQPLPQPRKD